MTDAPNPELVERLKGLLAASKFTHLQASYMPEGYEIEEGWMIHDFPPEPCPACHMVAAEMLEEDALLITEAVNALPALLAAAEKVAAMEAERDEARDELASALAIKLPDWAAWSKDIRKAAVRDAEPLDDERMNVFRHAVADNHCKSSSGERASVEWRVGEFAKRYGRRIVARLDVSEVRATTAEAEVARLREALLKAGAHCQGGHSDAGMAISLALGIDFPLRMESLASVAAAAGLDPNEVWPWWARMKAAAALANAGGGRG